MVGDTCKTATVRIHHPYIRLSVAGAVRVSNLRRIGGPHDVEEGAVGLTQAVPTRTVSVDDGQKVGGIVPRDVCDFRRVRGPGEVRVVKVFEIVGSQRRDTG